jgi:hypothetical protein
MERKIINEKNIKNMRETHSKLIKISFLVMALLGSSILCVYYARKYLKLKEKQEMFNTQYANLIESELDI